VSWKNTIADGFNVKAFVRYTPFNINFVPAFWEQFKWGWIQYVAVLLPFLFVFKLAKIFIFENQLVPTVVIDPAHKIKIS
jgi:transmembrane protein 231